MARYVTKFDGRDGFETVAEHATIDAARDAAIVRLGEYLQENPAYAYERHWRVDVLNEARRLLLHIIVATVEPPRPLNRESYEA